MIYLTENKKNDPKIYISCGLILLFFILGGVIGYFSASEEIFQTVGIVSRNFLFCCLRDTGFLLLICILGISLFGFVFVLPVVFVRFFSFGYLIGIAFDFDIRMGIYVLLGTLPSYIILFVVLSHAYLSAIEMSFDLTCARHLIDRSRIREYMKKSMLLTFVSFFAVIYDYYILPIIYNKSTSFFLDKP